MKTARLAAATLLFASAATLAPAQQTGDFFSTQIRNQALGRNNSVDQIISNSLAGARGPANFLISRGAPSSGGGGAFKLTSTPTIGFGGGEKPFASIEQSPAVSPYLNLFNTGFGGTSSSFDNYNTLVRPQLNQQQTNRALQQQTYKLNQRVQAISAQPDYRAQGSEQIMPTGHSTGYGYYSHYYPLKNARRRR